MYKPGLHQVFDQSRECDRGWTVIMYYVLLRGQFQTDKAQQLAVL